MEYVLNIWFQTSIVVLVMTLVSKAATGGVLQELSQNSQETIYARVSFLVKLQASGSGNSGTGVFLWILRNFKEHFFYRTPPGDCFWSAQECYDWKLWKIGQCKWSRRCSFYWSYWGLWLYILALLNGQIKCFDMGLIRTQSVLATSFLN